MIELLLCMFCQKMNPSSINVFIYNNNTHLIAHLIFVFSSWIIEQNISMDTLISITGDIQFGVFNDNE